MTMIELPRICIRVGKDRILERASGVPDRITVAVTAIQGVQRKMAHRIGVELTGDSTRARDFNNDHPSLEARSQILLADGKWYGIDLDYHMLIVLIASHTKVDPSAMGAVFQQVRSP